MDKQVNAIPYDDAMAQQEDGRCTWVRPKSPATGFWNLIPRTGSTCDCQLCRPDDSIE